MTIFSHVTIHYNRTADKLRLQGKIAMEIVGSLLAAIFVFKHFLGNHKMKHACQHNVHVFRLIL